MLRTALLLAALLGTVLGSVSAQPLPDSVLTPDLETACRGDGSRFSLYRLNWSIDSRPLTAAERAGLSPAARSAYALAEQHYRPYVDPQVPSTWALKYRLAVVQPSLQVIVAPDSSFERWERRGYPLDDGWDDPPVVRRVVVAPFRPALSTDALDVLYATPPYRRALVSFLLPLGVRDQSVMDRRLACLDDVFGLTDWARTSTDVHSPPRLSLTLNQQHTRAIAAYGWGRSGGVWVLYRRSAPGDAWQEVRPIGAWTY